jgi:hypothetical protein
MIPQRISRRDFLSSASLATATLAVPRFSARGLFNPADEHAPLGEFDYGDVTLASELD